MKQILTAFLLAAFALCAVAQDKPMQMPKGLKGSYIKEATYVQGQINALLDAFSNEQLTYRAMEGSRSTSEHFYHICGGNYYSMSCEGFAPPKDVDMMNLEKGPADKAKIKEALKKSFDFAADCISKIPESEYDSTVTFAGMKMTKLDVIVICIYHQHELLGELISYARINKVVPPWTAERQKKMQEQAPAKK